MTGSTALAGLHQVLKTAFGWDDEHLYAFTVHGVDHGTTGSCRTSGRDLRLDTLRLRPANGSATPTTSSPAGTTTCASNRSAPAEPGRRYPTCLAGARRVPPDDCDGPDTYLQMRADQPYALLRIAEILGERLDAHPDDRLDDVPALPDGLRHLAVYGRLDDFDRATRRAKKSGAYERTGRLPARRARMVAGRNS